MQLSRIKNIFKKASLPVSEIFNAAFRGGKAEDMEALEELLILSDISMETTSKIIDGLKDRIKDNVLTDADEIQGHLKNTLSDILKDPVFPDRENKPLVLLISGVNGSGKTTSIAKLAHYYSNQSMDRIMLSASDTFRAAADEQLKIWAERTDCDIYIPDRKMEPAAVSFNAYEKTLNENYDMLIIDTAGRMHTNYNLMQEINKIHKVLTDKFSGINLFSILVVDGTTGRNALSQAEKFSETIPIDTMFLTKIDGTAKGGTIITIADKLGLPISFVGAGEGKEDMWIFDKEEFINDILSTE